MNSRSLADLGWSAHYLSQLGLSELGLTPLRIAQVRQLIAQVIDIAHTETAFV